MPLKCPSKRTLMSLTTFQQSPHETTELLTHLDACDECRAVVESNIGGHSKFDTLMNKLRAIPDQAEQVPQGMPIIPGYQIRRRIGRGGMGDVFLAHQETPSRLVAIKLTQKSSDHETLEERFHAEIETAGRMDHPGIVPIYESGIVDDQLYFSMPFIDGCDLSAHLKETDLDQRAAASLMIKIAEAVEYANNQGVIHRDLKPSNVLIDQDGQPRVADFGIAKIESNGLNLTATEDHLGTAGYMSPEQAAGKTSTCTRATDVYGLGAILYRTLTGQAPFQGKTIYDTIRLTINKEPKAVSSFVPSVSRDLETICFKCLQKSPIDRYSSAAELRDDLQRFINNEPVTARPISGVGRAYRWVQRNVVISSAASLVIIAMMVTSIVMYVSNNRWQDASSTIENTHQEIQSSIGELLSGLVDDPRMIDRGVTQEKRESAKFLVGIVDSLDKLKQGDRSIETVRSKGMAKFRLGLLTAELDSLEVAIRIEEESRVYFEELTKHADVSRQDKLEYARLLRILGYHYWLIDNRKESETAHALGVSILESIQREGDFEIQVELGISKQYHAEVPVLDENWSLTVQRCELAKEQLSSLVETELPTALEQKAKYFYAMNEYNLGAALGQSGKPKASLAHIEQSLHLYTQLVANAPENRRFASKLSVAELNLGVAELIVRQNRPVALKYLENAADKFASLIKNDPGIIEYQSDYLHTLTTMLPIELAERPSTPVLERCERLRRVANTRYRLAPDMKNSLMSTLDEDLQNCAMNTVFFASQEPDASKAVLVGESALAILSQIGNQSELHNAIVCKCSQMLSQRYKQLKDFPSQIRQWKVVKKACSQGQRPNNMESKSASNHLGGTYCNWGHHLKENDHLKDAIDQYHEAIAFLNLQINRGATAIRTNQLKLNANYFLGIRMQDWQGPWRVQKILLEQ